MNRGRILVRGGGELASAAARLLHLAGHQVVVLERAEPLAVRRRVAFAEAVLAGACSVEGVQGRRLHPRDALAGGWPFVAVVIDEEGQLLRDARPDALVDGRMAKRNPGTRLQDAPLVVGLGPGFTAGVDVHAVVETQRGPELGRVIRAGSAQADTREPAAVEGVGAARVVRAPCAGRFEALARIGDVVGRGWIVGRVGDQEVRSETAGLVRGLVASGVRLEAGTKLGDIDPRGARIDPGLVSDKARAVAAGVAEAILPHLAGI